MSSDKQSRDDSAQGEQPWGRVAEDGTVYVRTADGERAVVSIRGRETIAVEPRTQLALLAAGERRKLTRSVRVSLDQRECLQHRVMQVRGDFGPFL